MEFELLGTKYKLIKNVRDAYNENDLKESFTEFFLGYDYVLGDYAYGKLRLKGFNKKENKSDADSRKSIIRNIRIFRKK